MVVEWATMKSFVDARKVSIQWIDFGTKYWLKAIDGSFDIECFLVKSLPDTTEQVEFETSYKPLGNKYLQDRGTLKMASFQITTNLLTGIGTETITIPATGRVLKGGFGRFLNAVYSDKVCNIELLTPDSSTVVEQFCDVDLPEDNRGWHMVNAAEAINSLTSYRILPGTYKIRITVKTGVPRLDTFYGNLVWGKL